MSRERKRSFLAVAAVGMALGAGWPPQAAWAAAEPPALPAVAGGNCVGPSPVVAAQASWPQRRMAPQLLWPLTEGAGTTVAVVDTGVSRQAPALAGAVLPGRDVVAGGSADDDCIGRGTALAGIVAARRLPGAGMAGMAPAVRIVPIRIVDQDGRMPPGALADGIRAAVVAGASVVLVGTGAPEDTAELRDAVTTAVDAGAVVVAAVNSRPDTGAGRPPTIWYPAADPRVLAVGGVDIGGNPTEPSPVAASVDVVAPSVGGWSVGPVGSGHYGVGGPAVAAAYVAGAVALVRSYHPDLSPIEVRARLLATAEPLAGARTPAFGAGVVDPYAAVAAVAAGASRAPDRPHPVVLPAPGPRDPAPAIAATVGGALTAAAATVAAILLTVRAARRRRSSPA